MHNVITSRHIRTSSELFLMIPLKPGFVPISELVLSYSARVSTVLSALFELRQQKVERGFDDPVGPIELLQTIYRVQWTVLEPFNEPRTPRGQLEDPKGGRSSQVATPQLVLTSHFDSSWENYFGNLVEVGGPLLDLIFSHCEDYEGNSCKEGFEVFSAWVRRYQRPCDFLFATAPEVTVDDLRYYKALLTDSARGSTDIRRTKIGSVQEESAKVFRTADETFEHQFDLRTKSATRAVRALNDIREHLFSSAPELGDRTGVDLYEDALASVLRSEPDLARLYVALNKGRGSKKTEVQRGRLKSRVDVLFAANDLPRKHSADEKAKPVFLEANEQSAQGNILEPYAGVDIGELILLRCDTPAALCALLEYLEGEVTVYRSEAGAEAGYLNFALTYNGLKRSGLSTDVLAQFPREFAEGMEERAGILGDVGRWNHPYFWRRPSLHGSQRGERLHLTTVDVAVIVQGKADDMSARAMKLTTHVASNPEVTIIHRQALSRGKVDRFQFVDHVSQPTPHLGDPTQLPRGSTALGEFLLGYADRRGRVAACAKPTTNGASHELFRDSTFLVIRKMAQDAEAFSAYAANAGTALAKRETPSDATVTAGASRTAESAGSGAEAAQVITSEEVQALVVGRRLDGALRAPLHGQSKDTNDFDFSNDDAGAVCPFHSHVRRANPRHADTPRIVRRGMSYGPDKEADLDDSERHGSLFMAYNASIAEQYEIVQRYINGGNSTGISSYQSDLLCGAAGTSGVPRWVSLEATAAGGQQPHFLTLPDRDAERPFVKLLWGLYLFVPSRAATRWLVAQLRVAEAAQRHQADAAAEKDAVDRGMRTIKEFDLIHSQHKDSAWKRILEEVAEAGSAQAQQADDVWTAIRIEKKGVLKISPERVVVGTVAAARSVLGDPGSSFSVCKYRERFEKTLVEHYLGLDASEAGYAKLATIPNRLFNALYEKDAGGQSKAFRDAKSECQSLLADLGDFEDEPDETNAKGRPRSTLPVRDLTRVVVARLCHRWFDMPVNPQEGLSRDRSLVEQLEKFLTISRATFQTDPNPHLVAQADTQGARIADGFRSFDGDVSKQLVANPDYERGSDDVLLRRALAGAVVGFAPPAVGAIIRVLDQWIETEELWRLQAARYSSAELKKRVFEALAETPSPTILYRTSVKGAQLHGVADLNPGTQVVVGLSSVYRDAINRGLPNPEAWLFGGQHEALEGKGHPAHGCPARDAGVDVMLGIYEALFERKNIKRERRLVLSYDRG